MLLLKESLALSCVENWQVSIGRFTARCAEFLAAIAPSHFGLAVLSDLAARAFASVGILHGFVEGQATVTKLT